MSSADYDNVDKNIDIYDRPEDEDEYEGLTPATAMVLPNVTDSCCWPRTATLFQAYAKEELEKQQTEVSGSIVDDLVDDAHVEEVQSMAEDAVKAHHGSVSAILKAASSSTAEEDADKSAAVTRSSTPYPQAVVKFFVHENGPAA
ncbi:hypothetical protein MMC15_000112 [Xylographa vitiligo]|nr:hypothetical protein [Xylographa vitiligo]